MTPEKKVQNKIVAYLKHLEDEGYRVWHQRREAIGLSYKKGIPDLYAIIEGRHVEIEVKAPGKELRPMQIKQREILTKAGALYVCCDNFEDFHNFIQDRFDFWE